MLLTYTDKYVPTAVHSLGLFIYLTHHHDLGKNKDYDAQYEKRLFSLLIDAAVKSQINCHFNLNAHANEQYSCDAQG